MRNKNQKSNKAFSLIEILITMAIIGILTSIGYPTYKNHITRTRRAQATVVLTNIAAQMEHYYNHQHTYQGATLQNLRGNVNNNNYTFSISNTHDQGFLIKAQPQKSQAKNDAICGTISINQQGRKTISGSGDIAYCYP